MATVAFSAFDFNGKGHVEVADFTRQKLSFKLPLTPA